MTNIKYTNENLAGAVASAFSFAEVARILGMGRSGNNTPYLKKRCVDADIDTSHFTGQGHRKGRIAHNKRDVSEILVVRPHLHREKGWRLRAALIEVGVPYVCNECGQEPFWNGEPLTLEVDHINWDAFDNRRENLQFLCPNCHSQREQPRR